METDQQIFSIYDLWPRTTNPKGFNIDLLQILIREDR